MKILCIGNSFSHDACKYLHDMAKAGGEDVKTVNLFIGGCSLQRHYNNILTDEAAYDYELNGAEGSKKISIKDALLSDEWDVVTTQQASPESGQYDTYYPYLTTVLETVHKYSNPKQIYLHETWAYEIDSSHSEFVRYDCDQQKMYEGIVDAYHKAAEKEHLPLIKSGEMVQYVRSLPEFDYKNGGQTLCRDGYHMHLIFGRYLVAAVWYETVLHKNILENDFLPENVTEDDKKLIDIIKHAVHEQLNK